MNITAGDDVAFLSRSMPCQRDDDGRRPADRYVVALDDFLSKIDRNWMVPDEHNWVPFDQSAAKEGNF